MQLIQVMQVRLSHLWPDFRVIFSSYLLYNLTLFLITLTFTSKPPIISLHFDNCNLKRDLGDLMDEHLWSGRKTLQHLSPPFERQYYQFNRQILLQWKSNKNRHKISSNCPPVQRQRSRWYQPHWNRDWQHNFRERNVNECVVFSLGCFLWGKGVVQTKIPVDHCFRRQPK